MSSCQINNLNHLYKFIIHKINKQKICYFFLIDFINIHEYRYHQDPEEPATVLP